MYQLLLMQCLAAIPLAVLFGIHSSFSMWQGGSFFSHTLSHSLLLPVSLGVTLGITDDIKLLILSAIFAIIFSISYFKIVLSTPYYQADAILTVISCVCLAIALLFNANNNSGIDVMTYITGDILTLQISDVIILYLLAALNSIFTIIFWQDIVLHTCNREMAHVYNKRINLIIGSVWVMQAIFIAISIKMVGILLISGTTVMPALLARMSSKNPTTMVLLSILYALTTMLASTAISFGVNAPAAAIVVTIYAALWLILQSHSFIRKRSRDIIAIH